jgi:hypothetical protein
MYFAQSDGVSIGIGMDRVMVRLSMVICATVFGAWRLSKTGRWNPRRAVCDRTGEGRDCWWLRDFLRRFHRLLMGVWSLAQPRGETTEPPRAAAYTPPDHRAAPRRLHHGSITSPSRLLLARQPASGLQPTLEPQSTVSHGLRLLCHATIAVEPAQVPRHSTPRGQLAVPVDALVRQRPGLPIHARPCLFHT